MVEVRLLDQMLCNVHRQKHSIQTNSIAYYSARIPAIYQIQIVPSINPARPRTPCNAMPS